MMWVYNPSGGQVATAYNTTRATLNLTNLAAGTYQVSLQPYDAATATLDVEIQ